MDNKQSENPVQKTPRQAQRELHEIEELAESSNPKDTSPEIARDRQKMPDELHHRGAHKTPRRDADSRH